MGALIPRPHALHTVASEEDVGAVRRAVGRVAGATRHAGGAMLAATELASNVLRHAGGGHLLVRELESGIELIAVDAGPGIDPLTLARLAQPAGPPGPPPSVAPGGLGVGLGAVRRLACEFDIYTRPQGGAVVLARIDRSERRSAGVWSAAARSAGVRSAGLGLQPPAEPWWAAVNVPLDGQGASGDACLVMRCPSRAEEADAGTIVAVLVDGLGHGPAASQASAAALEALVQQPASDPEEVVAAAHQAMRGTRGGVIGACVIDAGGDDLSFVGVGNVAGRVLSGATNRSVVSHGGTLGVTDALPSHRVFRYPWQPGATVILASDGLRGGWDPARYPDLLARHPAVIAAVLHRDFRRPNDDASVLVLKDPRDADDDRTTTDERTTRGPDTA